MNEQINQLAKQACDYAFHWAESDSKIDPKITPEQWSETYTQKFAELIVRECAQVAKTLPHTPERHWVTDSVTYIPVHCEQNILKHFGVEE